MIPETEMTSFMKEINKIGTGSPPHRVHPQDTHMSTITVWRDYTQYRIVFHESPARSYYVVRTKTKVETVKLIKEFDFEMYNIIWDVFKDHHWACEIAIGKSNA
jgi:hypothetical protein